LYLYQKLCARNKKMDLFCSRARTSFGALERARICYLLCGALALAQPVKPSGTKSRWRMFRHKLEELVVDGREPALME